VFRKAASDTPAKEATAENPQALAPINPKISDIEVVDLNNQHWLVPIQGPVGTPRTSAARAVGGTSDSPQQNKVNSVVTLPPPAHSPIQTAGTKEGAGTLVSALSPGGSESVSPARADHDSQPAVVATPTPDLPEPDLEARKLQPGPLLHRVEPVYPPSALAQGIEGTVTLYAVIGANGAVSSLRSLDGPPALVPAAIEAVRQWRYSPSLLNGRPIQTERQIKIVFQLSPPQ
jgi:TonB family protein